MRVSFFSQKWRRQMMTVHDERLEEIFGEIGSRMGYRNISAFYYPYRDLKSTWTRTNSDIVLRISDYLSDCPTEVLYHFARALCSTVSTGTRMRYPPELIDWLRSPKFIEKNRPVYLRRSRNLALSHEGESYDLNESFDRLVDSGLIKECGDVYLTWTRRPNRRRMGYCNVLMRTVAISSLLDSPRVPKLLVDYVLYHELLHILLSSGDLSTNHNRFFKMMEARFPEQKEAERLLCRLVSRKKEGR